MGLEIERKFLVHKDLWDAVPKYEQEQMKQGYLVSEPGKTIRVRQTESRGYLTIKGPTSGITRSEYEYRIPREDAEELIHDFSLAMVSKTRTKVVYKGKIWEVDEFSGDNEGLIVAELELNNENDVFDLPPWVDREVTGDDKYSNSSLSKFPFRNWITGNM